MSWTTPYTWIALTVLTAAKANEQIRDNMNETAAAKVTTPGDMVYANGNHSLVRFGIGSVGQFLEVVGGIPTWVSGGPTGRGSMAPSDFSTTSNSYVDATYGGFTVVCGSTGLLVVTWTLKTVTSTDQSQSTPKLALSVVALADLVLDATPSMDSGSGGVVTITGSLAVSPGTVTIRGYLHGTNSDYTVGVTGQNLVGLFVAA